MQQVCLQKSDMDLGTAVRLLESLRKLYHFVLFEHFERSASSIAGVCQSYKHKVQQIKKRKTFADETTDGDVGLSGSCSSGHI